MKISDYYINRYAHRTSLSVQPVSLIREDMKEPDHSSEDEKDQKGKRVLSRDSSEAQKFSEKFSGFKAHNYIGVNLSIWV